MKLTNQSVTFLFTLFILSVISIVGCSSTGIKRSEKATTTMQTMDDDIKSVGVQLDATGASLDELTKSGQSDVKKAFNLYTDNVSKIEKIEKIEKSFAKHADEMQARGKDYFEEWQKDGDKYKNSQIQQLSEQRRIELSEIYGKIAQNSIGVKEAFKAYVSDVKEIQNYLSNDLTPKGIDAIGVVRNDKGTFTTKLVGRYQLHNDFRLEVGLGVADDSDGKSLNADVALTWGTIKQNNWNYYASLRFGAAKGYPGNVFGSGDQIPVDALFPIVNLGAQGHVSDTQKFIFCCKASRCIVQAE